MSALLLRRRVRSVPTLPPSGVTITGEWQRWASGTGTTLYSLGVPLSEGQLLPANVGTVSVWAGGVEVPAYVEALGAWPDGSARSLFVQRSATGTNGSPVAGELRLNGTPGESRLSYTDDTATWSNTETGTNWINSGLPQGAFVCTSAAHLCAASSVGKLVPQSSQPTFTGSAAADTAFTDTYTSTVVAWDGTPGVIGPASYDRMCALYCAYSRTANVAYLRTALSFAARLRTAYWAPGGTYALTPEWQQPFYSYLLLFLLRRDEPALTLCREAASLLDLAMRARLDEAGGRFASLRTRPLAVMLAAGRGSTVSNYSARTMTQVRDNLFTEALVKSSTGLLATDDRVTLPGTLADGVTVQYPTLTYMMGMWLDTLLWMTEVSPVGTTNRAAVLAQISASVLVMRGSPFLTTSSAGVTTLAYADRINYFANRTGTVAATYTSGATSMQVTVAGWAGNYLDTGSIVIIGGTSRSTSAPVTFDGSGNATLTLASGFPSGYSSGQALNLNPISAAAPNAGNENTVDLNGFYAHLFAWRAAYAASTTDANTARTLYAGIGGTPRNGTDGPFLAAQKQWDESFHRSQVTLAYLAEAGV